MNCTILSKSDGTVKSPSAALHFIFRHCDVQVWRRAHGARLREIRIRFLSLVPSALCLVPFAYASIFARLAYGLLTVPSIS